MSTKRSPLQPQPHTRPQLICYVAGSRVTPLLALSPRQLRVLRDPDGAEFARVPKAAFVPADAGLTQHRVVFVGRDAARAHYNFYAPGRVRVATALEWVVQAFHAAATGAFADRPESLLLVLWQGADTSYIEALRKNIAPWVADIPLDYFAIEEKATLVSAGRRTHAGERLHHPPKLLIEDGRAYITQRGVVRRSFLAGLDSLKARVLFELGLKVRTTRECRAVWRELECAAVASLDEGIGRLNAGSREIAVTAAAVRAAVASVGAERLVKALQAPLGSTGGSDELAPAEIFIDEPAESLIFQGLRDCLSAVCAPSACYDLWGLMGAFARHNSMLGTPVQASDVDPVEPRVQRRIETLTTGAMKRRADTEA